jgi:regulator of nonsense transcripts 2
VDINNNLQTREIDLPADSTFAVAMLRQQQAEKEEQQRIKNLVLNLDLRDENDGPDGEDPLSYLLQPNPNISQERRHVAYRHVSAQKRELNENSLANSTLSQRLPSEHNNSTHTASSSQVTIDKHPQNPYMQPRVDKAGKGRSTQRARQLQVSDLDWYNTTQNNTQQNRNPTSNEAAATNRRRRGHGHKRAADGRGGRPLEG